jgi:hypothetical protein
LLNYNTSVEHFIIYYNKTSFIYIYIYIYIVWKDYTVGNIHFQFFQEHLQTCQFVEVRCPKSCNQNVERKVLEHHLKKECSKRTIYCRHCKTKVQHINYKVQCMLSCSKVSKGLGDSISYVSIIWFYCKWVCENVSYCWLCWKNKDGVIAYICKYWNISVSTFLLKFFSIISSMIPYFPSPPARIN